MGRKKSRFNNATKTEGNMAIQKESKLLSRKVAGQQDFFRRAKVNEEMDSKAPYYPFQYNFFRKKLEIVD